MWRGRVVNTRGRRSGRVTKENLCRGVNRPRSPPTREKKSANALRQTRAPAVASSGRWAARRSRHRSAGRRKRSCGRANLPRRPRTLRVHPHTVSHVSLRCAARCLRHRAGRVPRATLAYLAARPLRNSNSRGSGTGFGDGRRQVS